MMAISHQNLDHVFAQRQSRHAEISARRTNCEPVRAVPKDRSFERKIPIWPDGKSAIRRKSQGLLTCLTQLAPLLAILISPFFFANRVEDFHEAGESFGHFVTVLMVHNFDGKEFPHGLARQT